MRPLVLTFIACLLLSSCEDSTSPSAPASGPERSGSAVRLGLSGTLLRLGSTANSPIPEESPGWTRFGHDVWMDTTEMSQGEFSSLLGRNPSAVRGDRLPVTNVTWFDAVLAANARSRRDGLDTVYEYVSRQLDDLGSAVSLGGFSAHLDRAGWRLPTEAEWEAGARAGSATEWAWGGLEDSARADEFAWHQGNSGGRVHETGTKAANAWALRDMAGNAMEWTNDWKGSFPADTTPDFAGREGPGDVPEVPLKGGAYAYGLPQLRPSSRTATYAAYRSSRAEYVGFRLVRGGFQARFLSASGTVVQTPPVSLLRSDLARLLGTWDARLVFLNRTGGKGVLSWVDYAEANPVVRSLPDPDPVFHPVISPDGRWVAWCTALEGSATPSRVKARRLSRTDTAVLDLGEGAIPRWWTDGADTFLVRADAMDNTASGWSATRTTARRWSGGNLLGEAVEWAPGSYHDGRSGPYLYSGFRRLRQYDLRSGRDRILFSAPRNGKSAGDTSQVCNVSAAPDSSGRSLFLDFGYAGPSTLVGRPYGIHEVAFVADSLGNVVRQIPAPIAERQWEHLEWSNDPRWAVSGSIDPGGAYRNLYAVDVESGEAIRIVSGQELWQPSLWVGPRYDPGSGSADPDSAADYEVGEFAVRGAQYWARSASLEAVFVGSSHMANGVLPEEIRSVRGQVLAFAGSTPFDQDELVRQYVLGRAPRLKIVALSLMPGWLFEPVRNPSRSPWFVWKTTKGYLYDHNHDFWKQGLPPGFRESARWREQHAADRADYDSTGAQIVRSVDAGWSSSFSTTSPIAGQDASNPNLEANLAILKTLVKDLTDSGIRVVVVKFPESPAYANQDCATRYGPGRAMYGMIMDRVAGWEKLYPRMRLYDANLAGRHDYLDSEASNTDHLNLRGAKKFSVRLDSVFADLLAAP